MQLIDFKKYPKIELLNTCTEIQFLTSLSASLGVNVYIKRDDLNGVGLGGNKVRKLEYLLGDARQKQATHILTLGAIQSNHARLTAVTARMAGFEVELFLKESVSIAADSYQNNGNIILDKIVDVKMHRIANDNKMMEKIEHRMEEIRGGGGNPYFIPVGGSNALGNLGYLSCFSEIVKQQEDLNQKFDYIVCASGSGGTHGGLILGQILSQSKVHVKAYGVEPGYRELMDHTLKICNESLQELGANAIAESAIDLNCDYCGQAYGFPEKYHLAVLKDLAQKEGVFLDPVYTAKAFYGMIEDIKKGFYPKDAHILFIHTGGIPGIFAYQQYF